MFGFEVRVWVSGFGLKLEREPLGIVHCPISVGGVGFNAEGSFFYISCSKVEC